MIRIPRFLRRFFRRHTNPMSESDAWSTKDKLAIAYAIIAWNAGGLVLWQIFGKGNIHWPVTAGVKDPKEETVRPAIQFAHLMNLPKATVYRVSGTQISPRIDFEVDSKAKLLDSYRILSKDGKILKPEEAELAAIADEYRPKI